MPRFKQSGINPHKIRMTSNYSAYTPSTSTTKQTNFLQLQPTPTNQYYSSHTSSAGKYDYSSTFPIKTTAPLKAKQIKVDFPISLFPDILIFNYQICVEYNGGKTQYELSSDCTIDTLKEIICEKENIHKDRQSLFYKDDELWDYKTLDQYIFGYQTTLMLRLDSMY